MNMQETRRILTFALMLVVPGCGDGNTATPDAAPPPPPPIDAAAPPAFTLTTTPAALGERLVDNKGQALYFFANDVAGTKTSACTSTGCTGIWSAFDVPSPTLGAGLTATDFDRFDRGGGVFQTTWKGRPLYHYIPENGATTTAGENFSGAPGRWFVARAYNLFVESVATITPQATPAATAGAPFFTNGGGRSVYFFKNDTQGTANTPPVNTCTPSAGCAAAWTPWTKPATVVGPSTVLPADITALTVTVGAAQVQQFVYKGWPLYFFNADTQPGQVAGASIPSAATPLWFTINVSWNGTPN